MQTTLVSALLAMAFLAPAAQAHCGSCGMGGEKTERSAAAKPHEHKMACPAMVDGAEISVTNTAEGVTVSIKSKDAEAVKKIQEAGAKMAKGECCAGHDHKDGKKDKKKS